MKTKEWIDDLLGCPSQCYYYFETNSGRKLCIYLRWRYSDPWTADLVEFPVDWDWDKTNWSIIELSRDYKEEELDQLKQEALRKTINLFRLDRIKKKGELNL